MLAYIFAVVVIAIAALLAFGMAALLHLQGTAYIVFVVVLLLIGLAAAAVILIMHFRAKKNQAGEPADSGSNIELDLLLNDANRKLRTAQQGSRSLDTLPLIYILGESGTAKTSQVLRSSLDPELLAGTAPREGDIAPTSLLNLWFTRQAAILELGESVRQSAALLTRLVNRTRPKAYRSAFGSGAASRAAIVCLSADQLLRPDAAESLLVSARTTGAQLREVSRLLGTPLPVYVIVTKLDRVPHFDDYVRNLSQDEVARVLGLTLPRNEVSAGVYAERASRELATVLDGLTYTLGEFRTEMLGRETDPKNAPGVYEFPREFGKLRKLLNQYLVELSKPSHLSANPYLRGFYFTGIRAQIIETASVEPVAAAENQPRDYSATSVISIQPGRFDAGARPTQPPKMISKRVPQWTFLPRLFPEVILGDKSALSATQQTAPARLFRRILFASLASIFFLYTILLVVSFFNNRGLESDIHNADQALSASSNASTAAPSLGDLKNLDMLRQTIVKLDEFQHNGAPWSYRYGLYQGEKLAAAARGIYFAHFKPMFLTPTQQNWISYLHALPSAPGPTDDASVYKAAYDPLEAYLITAKRPDKSDPAFLTPVFYDYWAKARPIDPDSRDLARTQITFYGTELLRQDPYPILPDIDEVRSTRSYLSKFLGVDRVYQNMLNAADKSGKDKTDAGIDFKTLYPNSRDFVTAPHRVRGAYTAAGFAYMQVALRDPKSYRNGEPWVLGEESTPTQVTESTRTQFAAQYSSEYLKEWKTFLNESTVVGCGGLQQASGRFNTMASSGSPLLELFYVISHNTAVNDPDIKAAFPASQKLVDSNATEQIIGTGNKEYTGKLLDLGVAVDKVAQNQSAAKADDPSVGQPISDAASEAERTIGQMEQSYPVDSKSETDKKKVLQLLHTPVDCAKGLAKGAGAAGANGAGKKLCDAFRQLDSKFPFNPASSTDASIAEVNQVLAPGTGTLWTSYNETFKPLLTQQGDQYRPNATTNPAFATFFTRAAQLSNKLYSAGPQAPAFTFNLHYLSATGVTNSTFAMDSQHLSNGPTPESFKWNGADARLASLTADSTPYPYSGTWALFHLMKVAKRSHSPGGTRLDFPIVTSLGGGSQNAASKIVSYELSGAGADLLNPDTLSLHGCVQTVIKP